MYAVFEYKEAVLAWRAIIRYDIDNQKFEVQDDLGGVGKEIGTGKQMQAHWGTRRSFGMDEFGNGQEIYDGTPCIPRSS